MLCGMKATFIQPACLAYSGTYYVILGSFVLFYVAVVNILCSLVIPLPTDQVEIVEGKVTMCRDAVKGKCARANCKYYHNASSSASNTNASTTVAARATTLAASCSNLAAATMAAQ